MLLRYRMITLGAGALLAFAAHAASPTPTVLHAKKFDVSRPLRDVIRDLPPNYGTENERPLRPLSLSPPHPRWHRLVCSSWLPRCPKHHPPPLRWPRPAICAFQPSMFRRWLWSCRWQTAVGMSQAWVKTWADCTVPAPFPATSWHRFLRGT